MSDFVWRSVDHIIQEVVNYKLKTCCQEEIEPKSFR